MQRRQHQRTAAQHMLCVGSHMHTCVTLVPVLASPATPFLQPMPVLHCCYVLLCLCNTDQHGATMLVTWVHKPNSDSCLK